MITATIAKLPANYAPWRTTMILTGGTLKENEYFIHDLKRAIVPSLRRWDEKNKRWLLKDFTEEPIRILCREHECKLVFSDVREKPRLFPRILTPDSNDDVPPAYIKLNPSFLPPRRAPTAPPSSPGVGRCAFMAAPPAPTSTSLSTKSSVA